MSRRLIAPCVIATIFLANACAWAEEDPEIDELEAAYRSELIEIRDDLGTKWLSALATLRDQLTREQKFTEALLVRGEVQRVGELLKADPLPAPSAPVVEGLSLLPGSATLSKPLRLGKGGEGIGSWSETGASATWELPADIIPGTYELILHFQAGEKGGGTLKVAIGEEQALTGEITASRSDSKKSKRSLLLGECVLDEHTGKLVITSLTHLGDELMVLNSIDLAPPGSWAEMQVQKELPGSGSMAGDAAQAPKEFELLEGARWVDSDTRESGEFIVSHGGMEYRFRLYYAELPPTEKPSSRFGQADLARKAKRLRTTQDRILRFGKRVDVGLRDEVWTEDLTIYTRWEKRGQEGAYLAYILVGETPMSLTLIEKGHAQIGRAFATQAPFIGTQRGTAKLYLNRLRAAEQEAKQSRRGLWGL
ncbi:MAG: thermonuclease family protein [Verrucomicrobiales bacterium]